MISFKVPFTVLKAAMGACAKHDKRDFLNYMYILGDRRLVACNGDDITYASDPLAEEGAYPPAANDWWGFYLEKAKVCDEVQIQYNPNEGTATATGLKKDQVQWVEDIVVQGATSAGQMYQAKWQPPMIVTFCQSQHPMLDEQVGVHARPLMSLSWKLLKFIKDLECKDNKKTGLKFAFRKSGFIYIQLPHGQAVIK